jgi:hypothetical protein
MTETGAEFVPVVFLTSVDAWSPGDRAELSAAMTQGLIKGGFARYDDGPHVSRFLPHRPHRLSQD